MEKDDDVKMSPTTFDTANDTKMAKCKREISKLITSNNNRNNKPSQDEEMTMKKRKGSKSNNTANEDEEKVYKQHGRKRSLSVTFQDEKDLAFLGMIQQIQNNIATKESTSTKSRSKWEN